MQTLLILGRQPAIGLAELESLYTAKAITPLPGGAALLDFDESEIIFERLGGAIKKCKVLTRLQTTDWKEIDRFLVPACQEHAEALPEGKLTLGLSLYGLSAGRKDAERTTLSIKKAIRSQGRPVRIVPNKAPELSTPQILHNGLTKPHGWELVLYRDGQSTIIAQTTAIQDIEAYSARDQARPARDSRVGMLPPKLAQIIVNLAVGELQTGNSQAKTIVDPFCGTGVVLQEALLMGYNVVGTDLEMRMIEYTKTNIEWLVSHHPEFSSRSFLFEKADATNHTWPHSDKRVFACEGYLGLPFSHLPSDRQLEESIQSSNTIAKGFLKNLASQSDSGDRICIGLPQWQMKSRSISLPLLDQLGGLGWERVRFRHASDKELVYKRDGQIVGRELVVLVKI